MSKPGRLAEPADTDRRGSRDMRDAGVVPTKASGVVACSAACALAVAAAPTIGPIGR
jgi:hypothetical protein